jgi:hypothetical protein
MKKRNEDIDEIVPDKHWGSSPPDRTISTAITKTIGLGCVGFVTLACCAVVIDYFLLK